MDKPLLLDTIKNREFQRVYSAATGDFTTHGCNAAYDSLLKICSITGEIMARIVDAFVNLFRPAWEALKETMSRLGESVKEFLDNQPKTAKKRADYRLQSKAYSQAQQIALRQNAYMRLNIRDKRHYLPRDKIYRR